MSQQNSAKMKFYFALFAGLAALGTHFYLSQHYYQLQLGLTSGPAVCNINQTFNCDTVAASKFSSLFGIPMAVYGIVTQIMLLILTLNFGLGFSEDNHRIGRFAFYLSSFVAATSVAMGFISAAFLTSYCLFCILAYVLSFIHLYCLWSLQEKSPLGMLSKDLHAALTTHRWAGILVVLIVPLSFLLNDMFYKHLGGDLLKESVESSFIGWQGSPQVEFTSEGLVRGPSDARMTIVEFADFLCPHCKHAAPSLKVFVDSHPNVRLVFKAFPLDGNCNGNKDMPKGDGARCILTKTVFCAEKLAKKGWAMYEDVFEKQEEIHSAGSASDAVKGLVEKHGIDLAAMETCRNSEEIHKSIIDQSLEGSRAQIEGTPAIFVNGRMLSRGQSLPVLQRVFNTLE